MSDLAMGERDIPSVAGWPEAARRMFEANYTWAGSFAPGKVVLDCACGSGNGSGPKPIRLRTRGAQPWSTWIVRMAR